VKEIDFAGMARHMKHMKQLKKEQRQLEEQYPIQTFYDNRTSHQTAVSDDEVDEGIVGILVGQKLTYDESGYIVNEDSTPDNDSNKVYTDLDLSIYETQRDLLWWYRKQDVYQSLIGGGLLL